MISGSQIRMARAFLRWSVKDLAESAGVGDSTVKRMEAVDGVPNTQGRNLAAVQECLESEGLEFTADGCVCPPSE